MWIKDGRDSIAHRVGRRRDPGVTRFWRVAAKTMLARLDAQTQMRGADRKSTVIVRSSDQVPRVTVLKRFPVPRNCGVSPESRIGRGRTWSAPAGATRVKPLEIYRYDPDSGSNPRLDTFMLISMIADRWSLMR